MTDKFLATKVTAEEHKEFGIRAAEAGMSKSALMRKLTIGFMEHQRAKAAKGAAGKGKG